MVRRRVCGGHPWCAHGCDVTKSNRFQAKALIVSSILLVFTRFAGAGTYSFTDMLAPGFFATGAGSAAINNAGQVVSNGYALDGVHMQIALSDGNQSIPLLNPNACSTV